MTRLTDPGRAVRLKAAHDSPSANGGIVGVALLERLFPIERQSYNSRADGTPVPESTLFHTDFFFDPDWQSLPPDDAVYLLFVHQTEGPLLFRRAALFEDASGQLVVSGEYTMSGETTPLDAFRSP